MSTKHTDASADWKREYQHQGCDPQVDFTECNYPKCGREGESIRVTDGDGNVISRGVYCRIHRKYVIGGVS